ncbi:MAG TPA: hypothetical protein VMA13_09225 [Candidatus Saccharimonadales bacterium]|nr:hypothetical protein [Candidatus Saccharimonadales bacterium]
MLAEAMVSPEEQQTETNPPAPLRSPGGGRRRGRRGGRGHGRGPRHSPQTTQTDHLAGAPVEGTIAAEPQSPAVVQSGKDVSAISQAIDEIRQIVESLEQVLEQVEEVRELVEKVEQQQSADEREIESLRRALRRIHQPRGNKEAPHEPASA